MPGNQGTISSQDAPLQIDASQALPRNRVPCHSYFQPCREARRLALIFAASPQSWVPFHSYLQPRRITKGATTHTRSHTSKARALQPTLAASPRTYATTTYARARAQCPSPTLDRKRPDIGRRTSVPRCLPPWPLLAACRQHRVTRMGVILACDNPHLARDPACVT
eukprot:365233-Chlamydomonas_euryale.AAC.13